jgi:hypothetical protein
MEIFLNFYLGHGETIRVGGVHADHDDQFVGTDQINNSAA